MTRSEFQRIYEDIFPNGDSKMFADHVFRTYDNDSNGYIDFQVWIDIDIQVWMDIDIDIQMWKDIDFQVWKDIDFRVWNYGWTLIYRYG